MNIPTGRDDQENIEEILGIGNNKIPWWRSWQNIGTLLLLVVAALVVYTYLFNGSASQTNQYVTDVVTRGGLSITVTATGTVEPTNEVEISSELSGIIRSVNVDYNDQVTSGQILAVLDTDRLEAQLAHSQATLVARRASLIELQATLTEKKNEYDRVKPLAEKGHSSQSTLDIAKAGYDRATAAVASARAAVAVAEADLKLDETNLKKANILSPINGVVLKRNIDPGQTVAASFQAPVLFTLADDLRKMQLEVDIDEADIGTVNVGNQATFTVESYQNKEFPAQISELRFAPETVEGVVTYKAVLTIDNQELLLRPGMTATAEIIVQTVEDALLIPNAALRYTPPTIATEDSDKSFIQSIMPRPSRSSDVAKIDQPSNGDRRIWVLQDNEPIEVQIRVGVTDGVNTQVLTGDLKLDDQAILDNIETVN
tara:strand:- start:2506 stop:3792 length:1287 start_codon:yes stop_codon:yes gene_type:complete